MKEGVHLTTPQKYSEVIFVVVVGYDDCSLYSCYNAKARLLGMSVVRQ